MQNRIEVFRQMLEADPENTMVMFGLAKEYEKLEQHAEVIKVLEDYLSKADDEGNAYGRLARGFLELGREDEARDAYRQGIAAASRHGHPTMVMEYEEALEEF